MAEMIPTFVFSHSHSHTDTHNYNNNNQQPIRDSDFGKGMSEFQGCTRFSEWIIDISPRYFSLSLCAVLDKGVIASFCYCSDDLIAAYSTSFDCHCKA